MIVPMFNFADVCLGYTRALRQLFLCQVGRISGRDYQVAHFGVDIIFFNLRSVVNSVKFTFSSA